MSDKTLKYFDSTGTMADIWSEKHVGFIGSIKCLMDLTVGPTYFAKSAKSPCFELSNLTCNCWPDLHDCVEAQLHHDSTCLVFRSSTVSFKARTYSKIHTVGPFYKGGLNFDRPVVEMVANATGREQVTMQRIAGKKTNTAIFSVAL